MKIQKAAQTRTRGFTFIEIMLVVLIIGILMAVVVPNMTRRTLMTRIQTTRQSMNAIGTMLSLYEMKADKFPTTDEGLQALVKKPDTLSDDQWNGPYAVSLDALKDAWGQEFSYRSPAENNADYDLSSKGPDKQEGTPDDITKRAQVASAS